MAENTEKKNVAVNDEADAADAAAAGDAVAEPGIAEEDAADAAAEPEANEADAVESGSSLMQEGVSLRTLYAWLIVIAVIISSVMIYSTFHLTRNFYELSDAMDNYIELEKAANDLMDASDYLTENVQRFTVHGNVKYMNDYFDEAFTVKRRERAVETLSKDPENREALEELQRALDASRNLMNREYYAMRLVIEAKGYTKWPEVLDDVKLTAKDAALSPERKMIRATQEVLGEGYYGEKEEIRKNMKASLESLEDKAHLQESNTSNELRKEINVTRIIIFIQTLGIFLIIWLTSILGIHPILKAVDRIKGEGPIPVVGANEFRYLANAYNKMYKVYKRSIEHLNYKASHDELTGVYNRAGYDLLLNSLDLTTTFMLFLDVDDFKSVNDTEGHEAGDHILVKVAKVLKKNFRSDDYICRIGGDEFVVFMVHADEMQRDLVATKIKDINDELRDTDDGLPAVSISVGIAHGKEGENGVKLFERADEAMYRSKRKGKHRYTFYND